MSLRWLAIVGNNDSAKALRTAVNELGFATVNNGGTFTMYIDEAEGDLTIDSVDSAFERLLVKNLRMCGHLRIKDEGGIRSDTEVRIIIPPALRRAAVDAVVRGFSEEQLRWRKTGITVFSEKPTFGQRARTMLPLLVLLLLAFPAYAQQPITVRDSVTGAVVPTIGSAANEAIRVFCVGGSCSGGGGGGGGTAMADQAVFTFGTDNLTPIGGVFDDTPLTDLTTGMVGVGRLTKQRALHVNLRDDSGNEITAFGGIQYTEGAVDPTITGTAILYEGGGNTLTVPSTAFPLPTSSEIVTYDLASSGAIIGNNTFSASTTDGKAGLAIFFGASATFGTITVQGSVDNGANWTDISCLNTSASVVGTTSALLTTGITATGLYLVNAVGLNAVQFVRTGGVGNIDYSIRWVQLIPTPYPYPLKVVNDTGASAVNIRDGGNSITVDGTITVTDGAGALNVIVDSSALPSGAATSTIQTDGTQKTRIVDAAGDTANVTGTSIDVNCTGGCGGAATFADNAAFTFGTTPIGNIGAVVDDTLPNAVTENSAGAPRMSSRRELYGQIRDAAGNERGANVNASNALLTAQTGALPAGTNNIGDVDVLTLPAVMTDRTQKTQLTDGTRDGTIKAASTASVAGDTSVVVALSPNSPLPAGTAVIGALTSNQSVNVAQINGVTPLMGVGASGTGAQRVAALLHDGTNTAAVKAASTVPVATDPALVVTISPNSIAKAEGTTALNNDHGVVLLARRLDDVGAYGQNNGDYGLTTIDYNGSLHVRTDQGSKIQCVITSTATVSTVITGCTASLTSGEKFYITDIKWSSSIISTTTNFMTIQYGTGSACATGTTVLYRMFISAAFMPVGETFDTPLVTGANTDLCFVHPGAGTRIITVTGFRAP